MSTVPAPTIPPTNFELIRKAVDAAEQDYHDLQAKAAVAAANLDAAANLNNSLQGQITRQQIANLVTVTTYDLDRDPQLLAAPGPVGNVGATGSLHGPDPVRTYQPDGSSLLSFQPKHKPGEPWDTWFIKRTVADYDPRMFAFIYRINWLVPVTPPTPGPLNFERIEQLETNWELQRPDFSTLNWGLALNLAGGDAGWKWFEFQAPGEGWRPLAIPYADHVAQLKSGKGLSVTQQLSIAKTPDGKTDVASFDSVTINGVNFPVGRGNPASTRADRLKNRWKPGAQYAHQADARGDDLPFVLSVRGMSIDVIAHKGA